MVFMKTSKITSIILTLAITMFAQENITEKALKSISAESLLTTDIFLSSQELGGRLAGSRGFYKAAKYAAERFKRYGLQALGDGGYFQNFFVEYNDITGPCVFQKIENNRAVKNYKLGKDYVCRGFTGSGDITAPLVFVGYGISEPELGYDDYANIDVKDKIVVAFKYNPKWKPENGVFKNAYPREKSLLARSKGAKAILFVSFPNDKNPQKPIGSVLSGKGEQPEDFPQLHIDLQTAKDFFSNSGYTLKELQTKIDAERKPHSVELKSVARIKVKARYEKHRKTMNVVALLEGADKELKHEYVVIGAHLDHVGMQAREIYFPGANDNASGSSTVLEVAKAFAENNIRPKRSVIFVLFSSEEAGLFGSKFFVEHPPVPLEQIKVMINLDCVAHGDSLKIGGGKSAPELWTLARELDKKYTQITVKQTWSGGGADATPFFEKGIKTLYFVSTNSYTYLHLPQDTPETLNPELFEKQARLAFLLLLNIANNNYQLP